MAESFCLAFTVPSFFKNSIQTAPSCWLTPLSLSPGAPTAKSPTPSPSRSPKLTTALPNHRVIIQHVAQTTLLRGNLLVGANFLARRCLGERGHARIFLFSLESLTRIEKGWLDPCCGLDY